MKDVMLAEMPIEERAEVLHDSCDQIEEKQYTRKFSTTELVQRRAELSETAIKLNTLANELADIRANFKQKMKPMEEEFNKIRDEIKSGGEYVSSECYKFIDVEEGKTAWYTPEGYKLEERDSTPEEKQRTMFQVLRNDKTGTND
jgi:aspartokinase